MKRILLLLMTASFFAAQAQDPIEKKTRSKKSKVKTESYSSKNGSMKVHELDESERLDSIQKEKITAPHVNNNFNENIPPLSPSNGNR